jgi:hypothetical protein
MIQEAPLDVEGGGYVASLTRVREWVEWRLRGLDGIRSLLQ